MPDAAALVHGTFKIFEIAIFIKHQTIIIGMHRRPQTCMVYMCVSSLNKIYESKEEEKINAIDSRSHIHKLAPIQRDSQPTSSHEFGSKICVSL